MRPTDINDIPVELGPWYWALSRTGQVVGTGKFLALIGRGDILFFINETGYEPISFAKFAKAEQPDLLFHGNCKICGATE